MGDLSPGSDGEHAGLCADTPYLGTRGVGTQPGQQLVPDILQEHYSHHPGYQRSL